MQLLRCWCATRSSAEAPVSDWNRSYYSFARFAFLDALRICGVKQGDSVLMPSYICRDVLAPVHALGANVEFYDVDRQLRPLLFGGGRTVNTSSVRAIMAVDYFGFPQHLDELLQLGNTLGVPVIEDNAHGYLSIDSNGTPLGQRTGIGFTSFRKTLRVVNGALLDVDASVFPAFADTIDSPQPEHSALPLTFRIRRVTGALERATHLPLLNASRAAVRAVRRAFGRPEIPVSLESETVMPEHRAIHANSLATLRALNDQSEARRRRDLFEVVADRLRNANYSLIFDALTPGVVPWSVPFFAHTADLTKVRRALRGLGLEIFQWPDLPDVVRRDCPNFYLDVHVVSMMR